MLATREMEEHHSEAHINQEENIEQVRLKLKPPTRHGFSRSWRRSSSHLSHHSLSDLKLPPSQRKPRNREESQRRGWAGVRGLWYQKTFVSNGIITNSFDLGRPLTCVSSTISTPTPVSRPSQAFDGRVTLGLKAWDRTAYWVGGVLVVVYAMWGDSCSYSNI